MTVLKSILATVAIGALVLIGGASAHADEHSTQSDVLLMIRVDGQNVPIDRIFPPSHPVESDLAANGGRSNLIDWDQWFGCYSLSHEYDIFSTYYTPSVDMHAGREINLRCGNANYGYKHIRDGKESSWQSKFDGAVAAGWNPSVQGFESWDDLMSEAAGTAIGYASYRGGSAVNDTSCANVNLDFYKTGAGLVYTFNAIAVYANGNDRLITAYPTDRTVC
ncbi:hypothetical protein BH09ACT6_BH09ACT6_12190 [soil metagenome]